MAMQITVIAALVAYLIILAVAIYVFVYADPDESAVARMATETIPRWTWEQLQRILGPQTMNVVEFFVDRSLLLVYIVIVFGSWSIVFAYIYPWIDRLQYVSPYHKYFGFVLFGACVVSWRLASTTNPGVITAKNLSRYNHFPYDQLLFLANHTCKTRGIPKLARSKFDRYRYKENIARYDHFCGWVYNTIGEENYRYFLLFLLVHTTMCCYGGIVLGMLFWGEILDKNLLVVVFVDRRTGEEVHSNMWVIAQYLFELYTVESAVFLLMVVMGIALVFFLGYHLWITSRGMTTNESMKWDQVRKWYKQELWRYNKAVKNGEPVLLEGSMVDDNALGSSQKESNKAASAVTDNDVTCTPTPESNASVAGTNMPAEKKSEIEPIQDLPQHPGPKPINVYDRGFVENWKEVIFPLSLRNDLERKTKES